MQRDVRGARGQPVPVRVHDSADSPGVRPCHAVDDRDRGREHARDNRDRDREGAQEHTELVHSEFGGGRFLPGPGDHAFLAGQRDHGLLDLRLLVVRHPLGHGRVAVHREHHELVPDKLGQVLEHHPGGRLSEEENPRKSGAHDRPCLAPLRPRLHPSPPRMEETHAG